MKRGRGGGGVGERKGRLDRGRGRERQGGERGRERRVSRQEIGMVPSCSEVTEYHME